MAQTKRLARYRNSLGCEPDHRSHIDRYKGPEMASMGSTSAPHEGQWNIPLGKRRISGCPHSQVCLPKASGNAIICSRVSSIAAPKMHPHRLQLARSPAKGCSSPTWQTGQTRKSDLEAKEETFTFVSSSQYHKGTLEAECEREHQHGQTEETHPPKHEQHNYRCDRI